ncbi:hypothetical protein CC80DRAFT_566996 [Byssothecium circinans]|uniref:Protein artemis n=1 Tax=Byssothecium circinans TaxID=147558 RepID=A0A6A5TRA1_9PLEO|nr:hypothetical protein CC80DRAFT_566996 [Byssothecium circinans]
MSTFKGIVEEFPHIRIDYFRHQPDHKAPLACFLSHVHSDHLLGLESFRAPFVYCSAATREILLRLEKFYYRANHARGILESHPVTYEKHMRGITKPLPLDTPTTIELAPRNEIRVTLIDANHCIGAVMFLIEGDGKAILYTGDIRAETWWVNSLVQNPVLLPYTLGSRRLDCMYLDTTFATKSKVYQNFPSKAEGIRELLEQVEAYPEDTIFYFHSWTFGYENVWIALSNFLQSRIHLDDYRARIYGSLSTLDKKSLRQNGLEVPSSNKFLQESGLKVSEAPALCGFKNGNRIHPGCLTSHTDVRIHSCERAMGCPVMDQDAEARVVHLIPIVNRVDNTEILEVGAGGGKGDLDQKEELEICDPAAVGKLMDLCRKHIKEPEMLSKVLESLQGPLNEGKGTINLDMDLQRDNQEGEPDMSLPKLVSALSSHASKSQASEDKPNKTIRFPYSRHSSYSELCTLVDAFKPKDVFPCTVDETKWVPTLGMRYLFRPFCSEDTFRHDTLMMELYEARMEQESNGKRDLETQQDTQTMGTDVPSPVTIKRPRLGDDAEMPNAEQEEPPKPGQTSNFLAIEFDVPTTSPLHPPLPAPATPVIPPADTTPFVADPVSTIASEKTSLVSTPTSSLVESTTDEVLQHRRANQLMAYNAALGFRLTWADYGGLVSTRRKQDMEEFEQEL